MIKRTNNSFVLATVWLIILAFVAVDLQAAPFPWTATNLNQDGETTLARDETGMVLTGPFLIHLILDAEENGPNPVSSVPGEYGRPTGDDLLITSWVTDPLMTGLPNGAFALFSTIESEIPPIAEDQRYYFRIFDTATATASSHFCNSIILENVPSLTNVHTIVELPDKMFGYVGNTAPLLEADDYDISVARGNAGTVQLTATDNDSWVDFSVIAPTIPGREDAFTFNRTGDLTATLNYIPPINCNPGDYYFGVIASDGELADTIRIDVAVTNTNETLAAFHLLTPQPEGTAFETVGFTWGPSHHLDEEPITYTFIWATESDWSDADSITGLTVTSVQISFDDGADLQGVPEEPVKKPVSRRLDRVSANVKASGLTSIKLPAVKSSGRSSSRILSSKEMSKQAILLSERVGTKPAILKKSAAAERNAGIQKIKAKKNNPLKNRTELPFVDEIIPITIEEGDSIYWRVRAVAGDDTRMSLESWAAYAEVADAPNPFSLISPMNNTQLATLSPAFAWNEATDPDHGDQILYDLIWSADDWETSDTIKAISGGRFEFLDLELMNTHPGAQRMADAMEQLATGTNELDEMPDESSIQWFVDAVDIPGLRRASNETWSFTISIDDAPSGFLLASPVDSLLISMPSLVELSWNPSGDNDPGAEVVYDVLITANETLENPAEFTMIAQGLLETTHTFDASGVDDVHWRWTVRAISQGDTSWPSFPDAPWNSFFISRPDRPEAFSLATPEDGGNGISPQLTLTWDRPFDPDRLDPTTYTLYYSIDNWETVDSIGNIPDTFFVFSDDTEGLIFGHGSRADVFPEADVPGAEGKLSLTSKAKDRLVVDAPVKSVTGEKSIPKDPGTFELDEFADSTWVQWKVRVQDSNSIGRWSSPFEGWSFLVNVEYPPTPFSLIAPDSAVVIPEDPTLFRWQEATDPDLLDDMSYTLQFCETMEFDEYDSATVLNATQTSLNLQEMLLPGNYWWRIVARDEAGTPTISNQTWSFTLLENSAPELEIAELPKEFAITGAYPNPFNPSLTVTIAVPVSKVVNLKLFDILGRQVDNGLSLTPQPGFHQVKLTFENHSSGAYFLQMEADGKMIGRRQVFLVK